MNLEQFGIFLIGAIVGAISCFLFHTFMKWSDEAQRKVIHHSREADHPSTEHQSDDHYQAVIKNRKERDK